MPIHGCNNKKLFLKNDIFSQKTCRNNFTPTDYSLILQDAGTDYAKLSHLTQVLWWFCVRGPCPYSSTSFVVPNHTWQNISFFSVISRSLLSTWLTIETGRIYANISQTLIRIRISITQIIIYLGNIFYPKHNSRTIKKALLPNHN